MRNFGTLMHVLSLICWDNGFQITEEELRKQLALEILKPENKHALVGVIFQNKLKIDTNDHEAIYNKITDPEFQPQPCGLVQVFQYLYDIKVEIKSFGKLLSFEGFKFNFTKKQVSVLLVRKSATEFKIGNITQI